MQELNGEIAGPECGDRRGLMGRMQGLNAETAGAKWGECRGYMRMRPGLKGKAAATVVAAAAGRDRQATR